MDIDPETVRLLRELWINEPVIQHALLRYQEHRSGGSSELVHRIMQDLKNLTSWTEDNIINKGIGPRNVF